MGSFLLLFETNPGGRRFGDNAVSPAIGEASDLDVARRVGFSRDSQRAFAGSLGSDAPILWELAIIIGLVFLNGLFAGAEMALLTLRKTRLQQLLEANVRGAVAIEALRNDPERFLATVQVGITIVGASAAAFGGDYVVRRLTALLEPFPLLGLAAETIALAIVIAGISYLTLVLGELVPKSIALRHPERYARLAGPVVLWLSWIARPLVWFLTASSNLILRPLGDRATFSESRLSTEELQQLVEEAAKTGSLDTESSEIASRALEFGDLTAADIMVPRNRIDAIPKNATFDDVKRLLLESGHSRMPVYDGTLDNIVGYVTAKDVLAMTWERELVVLHDLIRPAFFVPESVRATQLLKELQRRHAWLALVVDEHGGIGGLVTLEDLIEELVGDIFSEGDAPPEELVRVEPGGTALVRGDAPIREVNRELSIELPEGESWSTVAGLCMNLAGRIPQKGTKLEVDGGCRLEVVDASPRLVRLVRIVPRPPEPPPAPGEPTPAPA